MGCGECEMTGRNWQRMHQGFGPQPKRVHRIWLGAWWHLRQHRARIKVDADSIQIYSCWFTDQNTLVKRRHWHIGHMPGTRTQLGAPPVAGKLYVGVFAVEVASEANHASGLSRVGYETRVFSASGSSRGAPVCLPVRATIEEALAEYENLYHAV